MLTVMTSDSRDGTDPSRSIYREHKILSRLLSNTLLMPTNPTTDWSLNSHGADCAWFQLAPTLSIDATFLDLSKLIYLNCFLFQIFCVTLEILLHQI